MNIHRLTFLLLLGCLVAPNNSQGLEAGAASVDISPKALPAIRNGGFLQAIANRVEDPLHARALVLRSEGTTVALCVVDSCMLPTDVCESIKDSVVETVKLPREHILISSTHTHTAPGTMALCLGTRKDEAYTRQLIPQVAEAIRRAHANLAPAQAGWVQVDAHAFTNCRRWIRRPDRMQRDPFGNLSVRAMMHPGYQSPDVVGPAGPTDPQLSLLSLRRVADQKPLALLANYSMHYFGAGPGFSADYFGEMARLLEQGLGEGAIGIVSQGTSGDLHWMDYSHARNPDMNRQTYAHGLADVALKAIEGIRYESNLPLVMAETRLSLGRRLPSPERLAWAEPINTKRAGAVPKSKEEVYAEQAAWIHENPRTELILQALRLGPVGITALPNEVYGITGLKLKLQSPLPITFNIELANGAEGYIPPPEQHRLGGYTTWPARTAGLEEEAEPRIVEAALQLLEKVSTQPRRPLQDGNSPYRQAVLKDRPFAYWPLNDLTGPIPREATGQTEARWEDGVAHGLPGVKTRGGAISAIPEKDNPFTDSDINRASHVAGGRLRLTRPDWGRTYSVELWFWNGLPDDARAVTAYLFSRGIDGDLKVLGEHLGIGGQHPDVPEGRLFLYTGNDVGKVHAGRTRLAFRDWHHVVLVREEKKLTLYLDGKKELETEAEWTLPEGADEIFLGGRNDGMFGLEGRLDEVALYDHALTAKQVESHFAASRRVPAQPRPDSEPLEPAQALKALHLPEGFAARLVATEPQVLDPVAFDWDARGRLWVIEMADYPLGIESQPKGGGRIRILEDADGDGTYEKSTLFAEDLSFPNGLLTWRDGVLVTAAPDILFLEDRNGDGKADHREVLLSGLTTGNQQLRANGLRWGLDNWVHVAAGGHHGRHGADTVLHSSRNNSRVAVGSRDFRFRPDTGEVEPESGPTQFGRNRDDWGHWFGTQNSHPLWHYVLPDRYLRRNPHLAAGDGRVQLPGGSNPPVYPASAPEKRYHNFQQAGRYTSACAGELHRDSRLFSSTTQMAFICEPFHNLIQQLELQPAGVSFSGRRVGQEGQPDFFASSDRWCRPVMVRTGPDGAIWVADMYRYMIEHPQWLPSEGKEDLLPHYRLGEDRGRIYHIDRKGAPASRVPDLSLLDVQGLLAQLHSSNGWIRDKVHQLLLWQGPDPDVLHSLKAMATQAPAAVTRLHALCLLEGFGALKSAPVELLAALQHPHPGLRAQAIRLAEGVDSSEVHEAVWGRVQDPDPGVRLQLAFSLGQWNDGPSGQVLAILQREAGEDAFLNTAILSSALPHLEALAAKATPATRSKLLPMAMAARDRQALALLLEPAWTTLARDPASAWKLLGEFFQAAAARQMDPMAWASEAEDALSRSIEQASRLIQQAQQSLKQESTAFGLRLAAADLLVQLPAHRKAAIAFLEAALQSQPPRPEWKEVLQQFAATGEDRFAKALMEAWPGLLPGQRNLGLDALLQRRPWTSQLIQALREGRIRPTDLDPSRRQRLTSYSDPTLRKQASQALAIRPDQERGSVLARYQEALNLKGNVQRGHEIYLKACAVCHRKSGEGVAIGPDLETVVAHEPAKLLTNILDPSLDIQPGYQAYNAILKDGTELYGFLAGETGSSLSFKLPDGTTRTVIRQDISRVESTELSLMPTGLEEALSLQDMADLIAFLKQ